MEKKRALLPLMFGMIAAFSLEAQDRPNEQGGAVDQTLTKPPQSVPGPGKPAPGIVVQEPADPSAQEDKTKFRINKVNLTGYSAVSLEELRAIIEPLEGRDVTLAELKAAALQITRLYRSRGFLLAWAYVPRQEIRGGVVEIAVVEGRVDRVIVGGNQHYDTEFIFRHVGRIQGGAVLSQDALERSLLLLNEHTKMEVKATLRPGEQPGTTEIYLDVKDEFPVTIAADYDNFGSESISEHRFGATVGYGNIWDEGHELVLRGLVGSKEDQLAFGRIGYMMPIEATGLKVNVSFGFMKFEADPTIPTLEPNGEGPIYSLSVSYPIYKTRSFSLTAEIAYEGRDIRQRLGDVLISFDHMRVLSVGVAVDATDSWSGRTIVSLQYRDGLGNLFGGTEQGDLPSRADASNDFDKFVAQLVRIQKISAELFLIFKVSGQYCGGSLLAPEQFGIGGNDSVRGYHSFEYAGDYGIVVSAEFRLIPPGLDQVEDPFLKDRTLADSIQLAFFADWGEAGLRNPRPGERRTVSMEGVGLGLRVNYPGLTIRFDAAVPTAKFRPFDAGEDEIMFYVQVVTPLH